jgi:hypothetical protein
MQKKFDLTGIGECLIELYEEAPHIYRQSVAGDVFIRSIMRHEQN